MGEFDMPDELDSVLARNQKWEAFIKRIAKSARTELSYNKTDGIAIVNTVCLVDAQGQIVLWASPRVYRIEPSRDAKDAILGIMSSLDL